MHGRIQTRVLMLATVALGGMGVVGTGLAAGASSDATVVSSQYTINRGSGNYNGSATSSCPNGGRATGGGTGTYGSLPAGSYDRFAVQSTAPVDEAGVPGAVTNGDIPIGWFASQSYRFNDPSFTTEKFKTFALCSTSADSVAAVFGHFYVGVSDSGSGTAPCPAGTRVTGGGVGPSQSTPGAGNTEYRVQSSAPLDQSSTVIGTEDSDVATNWFGSAYNFSTTTSRAFKVWAICSATSDAVIEASSFSVNQFSAGSALATCPTGRRAVGGGVGTTGPEGDNTYGVQFSGPTDETGTTAATESGDVARGWLAGALSNQPGQTEFRTFALCASDPATGGGGGGGGGGNTGGGGGTTADRSAPIFLQAMRMLRARFRAGSLLTPTFARLAPIGTAFRFALSETSTVKFSISKLVTGRRVAGSCRARTFANRNRPRCTRRVFAGSLTRNNVPSGNASINFSGRIGRLKLGPARYVAVAQAKDRAGNASKTSSANFTVTLTS